MSVRLSKISLIIAQLEWLNLSYACSENNRKTFTRRKTFLHFRNLVSLSVADSLPKLENVLVFLRTLIGKLIDYLNSSLQKFTKNSYFKIK